jgi:hypothetical protein
MSGVFGGFGLFGVFGVGGSSEGIALADDRATTAAILDELDRDAAHKDATAAIVQRARDAIERARRMRATGDEAHAQLADGLARTEAETARDLVRALDAEKKADDARRGATDAGTVAERERALIEEGTARNGRLRAETAELGRPKKEGKTSSLALADAGAAAAAPTPAPKPSKAAPPGKSAPKGAP